MPVFVLCAVTVASSHAMDVSVLEGRWVLEAVNGKEIHVKVARSTFKSPVRRLWDTMAAIDLEEN